MSHLRQRIIKGALLLSLLAAFIIPTPVQAQDSTYIAQAGEPSSNRATSEPGFNPLGDACEDGGAAGRTSSVCQADSNNPFFGPTGVITRATQLVAVGVGVAAVVMIIIGGFKYVTSSGDPSNVESAKNTILFAVIGLVIALVAQAIVLFVLRRL